MPSSMLCTACMRVFQNHKDWSTDPEVPTIHQTSAAAVLNSRFAGCHICSLLIDQLKSSKRIQGKENEESVSALYTVCDIKENKDELVTVPNGEGLRSGVISSGLSFAFTFKWNRAMRGSDLHNSLTSIEYWMIADKKVPKIFFQEEWALSRKIDRKWALQKLWIQTCFDDHTECRPHKDGWMPTRVLGIADEKIQLLQPEEGGCLGKYATLSHCWGKSHMIKLTRATMEQFKRGIAFEELPKLYREMIDTCRDLGINYCWIDSLCIIQDDPDDWVHEAVLMGSVYRNSFCNIEASLAQDGDGSLIHPWDESNVKSLRLKFDTDLNGHKNWVVFKYSQNRKNDVVDAPLYKRAWVMQEQYLSPRSLIFTKTQRYWVCRRSEASEVFPTGVPDLRRRDDIQFDLMASLSLGYLKWWLSTESLDIDYDSPSKLHSIVASRHKFCNVWRAIVADYTRRSMSFEKDKLVALAGIAAEVNRKLGSTYQYVAGLWNHRTSIECQLCWNVGFRENGEMRYRVQEYRAPSWSWASVEGRIRWDYSDDSKLPAGSKLAFVENVEVETTDGTLMGPVKFGRLQIRGPFLEHQRCLGITFDGITFDDPSHGSTIFEKIYTLTMFQWYVHLLGQSVRGLVLQRVEDGKDTGCYTRLGTFSYDDWRRKGRRNEFMKFCEASKENITII